MSLTEKQALFTSLPWNYGLASYRLAKNKHFRVRMNELAKFSQVRHWMFWVMSIALVISYRNKSTLWFIGYFSRTVLGQRKLKIMFFLRSHAFFDLKLTAKHTFLFTHIYDLVFRDQMHKNTHKAVNFQNMEYWAGLRRCFRLEKQGCQVFMCVRRLSERCDHVSVKTLPCFL